MGNYASTSDVETRLRRNYTQLYTPRGETAVDTDVVAADIAAAEADLHSYLAARYAVPITDADAAALLKDWTIILVEERAYSAIPDRKMPEGVAERVQALRKRLADVAQGKLSLGTVAELTSNETAQGNVAIVDADDPEYTKTKLTGF